jgi:hypothetical protein
VGRTPSIHGCVPSIRFEKMSPVSKLENEAVESVEELIEALANAAVEIRNTEQSLRLALKRVNEGEELESVLMMVQPAGLRQALNDALELVNQRRHATRLKVFELALERGHSIADLGRAWGISRQLASRYIKETSDSHKQRPNKGPRDDG